MNKLLIVIDYQNDFVSGALGFEQAQQLELPLYRRVKQALEDGWKVLFTRDTHHADYLDTREGRFLPVPHCLYGSDGWHLYGKLAEFEQSDLSNVQQLDKPTFGSNEIVETVRSFCSGEPDEIELCGVVTSICVLSNAVVLHTAFLNSTITINSSLCAAPNPADHENALNLLGGMGYQIV